MEPKYIYKVFEVPRAIYVNGENPTQCNSLCGDCNRTEGERLVIYKCKEYGYKFLAERTDEKTEDMYCNIDRCEECIKDFGTEE